MSQDETGTWMSPVVATTLYRDADRSVFVDKFAFDLVQEDAGIFRFKQHSHSHVLKWDSRRNQAKLAWSGDLDLTCWFV